MAALKEFRKFMGLTQKEIAGRAGMSDRYYRKYEDAEYSVENMTMKNRAAIENAFGCSLNDIENLNLNIFTNDAKESLRSGELTVNDILSMDKRKKVENLSKIGRFGSTFSANFNRIPESLFSKLCPEDLAQLVDAFYDCYSDGKNDSH